MEITTLNTLMAREERKIPSRALYLLQQPLVEQLISETCSKEDGGSDGKLSAATVGFTLDFKQIVVLSASSNEKENVIGWGKMWLDIIGKTRHRYPLKRIAQRCASGEIETLGELHLLLERMVSRFIYKLLLVIIIAGLAVMALLQF